jgi:NADH-quinone oxidoreductase subunit N
MAQHYFETMGPMFVLTVTAFIVMILELVFQHGKRRYLTTISILGVVVALAVQIAAVHPSQLLTLNTMVSDGLGVVFSVLLLITGLLIFLFTYDYQGKTKLAAEHTYLILFALIGGLAMATSIDLVTLYVGLELLSVSSYVLVAVRKRSIRSVEGGIKYLVIGSIGSATLLYGLSFLYGLTGSTNLYNIGRLSNTLWTSFPALALIAFIFILAGLGVKLSLVPFHMWTPDAYDGAPAPISAFLATLSKSAAFIMLLRVLLYAFNGMAAHVFYFAAILSAVTMVIGNLLALPQPNMKRLLAFSSIAQAGYILIPIALFGSSNPYDWYGLYDNIIFYLFGYTFMTVGAFAIVHVVSHDRKTIDSEALVGLWKRSPWLTYAMTIFLLSLAGMPLTAGFVGKFYIFMSTLHLHAVWLGIVLFVASVISFFYYFGWIRKMFQSEGAAPITEKTKAGTGPVLAGAGIEASGTTGVLEKSAGASVGAGQGHRAAPISRGQSQVGQAGQAVQAGQSKAVSPVMAALVGLCVIGTLLLGIIPASLLHPLGAISWF